MLGKNLHKQRNMDLEQACSILQLPFRITADGLIWIYFVHTSKSDYFLTYDIEDATASTTGYESSQGQMNFGAITANAIVVRCSMFRELSN